MRPTHTAVLSLVQITLAASTVLASGFPHTEVKIHNGAPTLFINGTPHSGWSTMTYDPSLDDYRELSDIGVDVFSFSTTSDYSFYGLAADCWKGPDEFDYSQLDERANMVVEANPQAWLLPRVYVSAPPWWLDAHPEEICVFGDGGVEEKGRDYPREKRVASWASELWRTDTAHNLSRLIDHVKSQPYGNRVIGYHIASGITEEWMHWGFQSGQLADYSAPCQKAFQIWLEEKYSNDENLQRSWNDASIDLTSAEVPSATDRRREGNRVFLDPATEQPVIDYNLFFNEMAAETILGLAEAVKEKTHGSKLVGVFYGYLLQISGDRATLPSSGHLALDRMLRSPHVDFFSSPSAYSAREPVTGFSTFMSLTESFRQNGKLWVDENDYRTYLASDKNPRHGYVETLRESVSLQWREAGNVLAHGMGMWWFNMQGGWYSDQALLTEMKRMLELGRRSLDLEKESAAQIAIVVDPLAPCYLRWEEPFHGQALRRAKHEWAKLRAPSDLLTLNDYIEGKGGPYRMAVFSNLVRVDRVAASAIMGRLQIEASLALWQYAPGFLSNGGFRSQGIGELTGIQVREIQSSESGNVVVETISKKFGGCPFEGGLTYRTHSPLGPLFQVSDSSAEILGTFQEGNAPALALKRMGGWTTVYSAIPVLSADVLKNLACLADVHLYTDEPAALHASNNWISYHAPRDGTHTIRLPAPYRVEAVAAHPRIISESATEFSFPLNAGETELFLVSPGL